jgi:hypothetical protein
LVSPIIINDLSDRDAQLLIITNICLQTHKHNISIKRIFNKQSLLNFQMQLSSETWDDIFSGNDFDTIFNSFLNTYLRIFHSSFPLKKVRTSPNIKINNWITPGVKISCRRKRELYALRRNNNVSFKNCYKSYCKILSSVISTAKRLHNDRLIANSKNKMKTTWNIVKHVTGKMSGNKPI